MKFQGVLTWAMSGDSRNHVYQIRAVIDRGGIVLFNGYPAVANGFAALMGGWQYGSDSVAGGHLGSEIRILGITSALILVICSVLSGLFLKTKTGMNVWKIAIITAVVSMIPFSQLFLNTYLSEGFFPSSLSLAVLLAVIYEVARDDSSTISKIVICIMGSSLILLTFPLLLPLLLPCFFFTFLSHVCSKFVEALWVMQIRQKILPLIFLFMPVLIVELVCRIPSVSDYLFLHLNTYGRITEIDNWGLWALTSAAGLAFFFAAKSDKFFTLLTFFIGVFSIQFSIIMDRILVADYYVNKLVWISTTLMIILNLIISASLFLASYSLLKRLTIGFVSIGLIALASLPILQDFPLKPNLITLATSPDYPSAEDAHLITKTNEIAPRSIFWQVSDDFGATQVIDIWMTLGFDFENGAFTWGYNSDVFSLSAVCSFAKDNYPATIWVTSTEVQQFVRTACEADGVIIRVIST
jgi:hypothetical protein